MSIATFRLRKEREAAQKAPSKKTNNKKATKAAHAKSSKKAVDSNGSNKHEN